MTRPFKVLGIQQIAIGGPSKAKLRELWVDMLGLEVSGNFVSERENVDEDICAMGLGTLHQAGQKRTFRDAQFTHAFAKIGLRGSLYPKRSEEHTSELQSPC